MEIIDSKKIKTLSLIGQRATLGTTLLEIEKNFENLLVLSADTSTSAGLDKFRKTVPEKYIEMGISEQNMISVASGLSSEGFNVLTTTFSPFQVLRCLEQIKVNISYMKNNVTMVGLASGVALGNLGYTHCSIEDISCILSIPGINIISPSDGLETYKAIIASLKSNNSNYIRLTGQSPVKQIYETDYEFKIGKSQTIIDSLNGNIALLSNGVILSNVIEAAKKLKNSGYNCSVYNFHTIRPLDLDKLQIIFNKYKYILTIEEHNIDYGFGMLVSNEALKSNKKINLKKLGLRHTYDYAAEYKDILKANQLDIIGIETSILDFIKT